MKMLLKNALFISKITHFVINGVVFKDILFCKSCSIERNVGMDTNLMCMPEREKQIKVKQIPECGCREYMLTQKNVSDLLPLYYFTFSSCKSFSKFPLKSKNFQIHEILCAYDRVLVPGCEKIFMRVKL